MHTEVRVATAWRGAVELRVIIREKHAMVYREV